MCARGRFCRSSAVSAAAVSISTSTSGSSAPGPHRPQPRPRRIVRAFHLQSGHHHVPPQPSGGPHVRDDSRELGHGGLEQAQLAAAAVIVVVVAIFHARTARALLVLPARRALSRGAAASNGVSRSTPVLFSAASSPGAPFDGVQDGAGVPPQRREHPLDGADDEPRGAPPQSGRGRGDPRHDEGGKGQRKHCRPVVGPGGVKGGRGGNG